MKYLLNPKDFKFNDSNNYPELHDFFKQKAFVKVTGEHFSSKTGDHAFWYTAITTDKNGKYIIYKGVFFKGNKIVNKKTDWPNSYYEGFITTESFAKDLLCNLMATPTAETVQTHGAERLEMECLYKEMFSLNIKNKENVWLI